MPEINEGRKGSFVCVCPAIGWQPGHVVDIFRRIEWKYCVSSFFMIVTYVKIYILNISIDYFFCIEGLAHILMTRLRLNILPHAF